VSSVIRHDLLCADPAVALRFYTELFGWEPLEVRIKGYEMTRLTLGERVIGAIVPFDRGGSGWIPYVQVADVDACCARVGELGGDICIDAVTGPPGRYAVASDPTEAVFSPFVPRSLPSWAADAPPACAFAWDELRTDDCDRARGFYTQLFGWTSHTVADRLVFASDELPVASVIAMPERVAHGPMWLPYVRVDDTERAAIRATKLGAKLCVSPSEDDALGTVAVVRDPTGAYLGIGESLTIRLPAPPPTARITRGKLLVPRPTRADMIRAVATRRR
jgi:hypothetical protein